MLEKQGNSMKKLFTVYAYIVCALSAFFVVIMMGIESEQLLVIFNPRYGLSQKELVSYGDNDNYRRAFKNVADNQDEQEVTRRREVAYNSALSATKVHNIRETVSDSFVLFGFVGLFLLHWRLVKKLTRKNTDNSILNI